MIGAGFPPTGFNQRDQPPTGDRPLGMVPPGYGEPDFGEDQVKSFLKAQRQGQENPTGLHQPPPNTNPSKWGPSPDEWSGPSIPAGPNSFNVQPPKSSMRVSGIQQLKNDNDPSQNGSSPERETTPTPEDNMDFGEEPLASGRKEEPMDEKPISQRKVYEELQRKHKEKEMRLESVKAPNPMFKEDNWYSSEEESEEKSDPSFSDELMRTPGNLKRKSPDKKTSTDELGKELGGNNRTLPPPTTKTTVLSLRETPATPPPPPTLSASDRDSMEASTAPNGRVALPKELTEVLSSIQNTPSSSASFESNTSSPVGVNRDPR